MTEHPEKRHPCAAPFSQLYVVPRTHLDIRFCPYHAPTHAPDQQKFLENGTESLHDYLNDNPELARRRAAYMSGDYIKGAGCSSDCFWYQRHANSHDAGFTEEQFRGADGRYRVERMWLSTGPDCNITCRYCLDPKEFKIDYKSCDLSTPNLARDLVAQGGNVLLTGGEPFMPKYRLCEILQELTERGLDKVGRYEIHTNGTYLTERARGIVLRGPVSALDISMDTLRPDLFDYLRRGSKFEKVWANARALVAERAAVGSNTEVKILCAMMKANSDHIVETVERVVAENMTISLNVLFRAYYSPDFSGDQSLTNLGLPALTKLAEDIDYLERKYGSDGPVYLAAFKGQLQNIIAAKRAGGSGKQVVLGMTSASGGAKQAVREFVAQQVLRVGEAPRKASVVTLVKRGQFRAAAAKLIRRYKERLSSRTRK